MRVYISTDFEGVAGIVDWDQILQGRYDYEMGRRLLLGELNAAIEGALEAGATSFVVNDSHNVMRNLPPDEILGRASLLSGKHKPLYMMEGLDSSFDAIFLLGLPSTFRQNQSADYAIYYEPLAQKLATGGSFFLASRPALRYPPGIPVMYAGTFWISRAMTSITLRRDASGSTLLSANSSANSSSKLVIRSVK
jgi:hypothetical protein